MLARDVDLLAIDRGAVTAPAGCGKTELIARALGRHQASKPVLVLTHTNAGVVALRGRLDRASVRRSSYRLSTIDGWAMRLITTFPSRSAHNPDILNLRNPRADYPKIRDSAVGLLQAGHVKDILAASYARLIVDEYQDCSLYQHRIVSTASETLPTAVLGDPMQAIFGFGSDRLVHWTDEACTFFPVVEELTTPWRWMNAGAQTLGQWLLDVRQMLVKGEPVDISKADKRVAWIPLDGSADHERRLKAARVRPADPSGCVLIIGDSLSPMKQQRFASQTPGAVTVEAVDLRDLVSFAGNFDVASPNAINTLTEFAEGVMTGVGAVDLGKRLETLRRGAGRKPPNDTESACLAFIGTPSALAAVNVLVEMNKQSGVRSHRPAVLRACIAAFRACDAGEDITFFDAVMRMREQNRLLGRPLPRRAVGSTLLLKGLEADTVVILDAESLDPRNLYVALTRGSKQIVICAATSVLSPHGAGK